MRLRRLFRSIVFIAAAITLLLLAAFVIVQLPFVQLAVLDKLREILVKEGIAFQAKNFEYGLWRLTIDVRDAEIAAIGAEGLPKLARIEEMHARLSWRALLEGRLRVEEATVKNPSIAVIFDDKGNNNLPKPRESKSESTFRISRLAVSGGSLLIEERGQKVRLTLPEWHALIRENSALTGHSVEWKLGRSGEILAGTRKAVVETAGAVFDQAGSELRITSGNVVAAADEGRGTVQFQGTADKLDLNGKLQVRNLDLPAVKEADVTIASTLELPLDRLTIRSLDVQTVAGRASGDGVLSLVWKNQSSANLRLDGVELDKVSRALKLPVVVMSRVSGTVSASWPGMQVADASTSATAELRMSPTASTFTSKSIPVAGAVALNWQQRTLTAVAKPLAGYGTRLEGQAKVFPNRAIAGKFNAVIPSVAAVLKQPDVDGPVSAAIQLSGTVDNPQAAADVSSPALRAGKLTGVGLKASAVANKQQLKLQPATLTWKDQSATIEGTIGLASEQLALKVTTSDIDLAAVLAGLNQNVPASGTISIQGEVAGTASDPSGQFVLTGSNLAAYQEPLGNLNAEVQLQNKVAVLNSVTLERSPNEKLTASGEYHLDTKAYTFEANAPAWQVQSLTVPDVPPIRGRFALSAKGAGTVDDPQAEFAIKATDLTIDKQTVSAAELTGSVSAQKADLNASVPDFSLKAKASIAVKEPYQTDFEITADKTDLSKLPLGLEKPIQGTATGVVRGQAPLKDLEKATADIRLADLQVTWQGRTISLAEPAVASVAGGLLTLQAAQIQQSKSKIRAEGTVPLLATAPAGTMRVSGGLDLAELSGLLPEAQRITADGTIIVDGSVTGRMGNLVPSGTASLEGGQVKYGDALPLTAVNLKLNVVQGEAKIEQASASYGAAKITATGSYPLPSSTAPLSATVRVENLELNTLPGVPKDVAGKTSLHVEAQAAKPVLDAVVAKATIDELNLQLGNYQLAQPAPSTASLRNGLVTIDQFELKGTEANFKVSGTARLGEPSQLDLKLAGNGDAALLAFFSTGARVRGPFEVQASVTGTTADPKMNGALDLKDAQVSLPNAGLTAERLDIHVDLAGDKIALTKLSAEVNGGSLTGSGSARIAGGQPQDVSLDVTAKQVYFSVPKGFKTMSTGTVYLRQPNGQLILGGKVIVDEGSFTEPLMIEDGLLRLLNSSSRRLPADSQPPIWLANMRYNVNIESGEPIIIDNNLAKLAARMRLRLVGTYRNPSILGRVGLEEGGEIRLASRKYSLERGEITFTNDQAIEPYLNMQLLTQVAGNDVTMNIQGGGEERIQTTFTSDPPLPEPDIIALLLTGKTLDEARGSEVDIAKGQFLTLAAGSVGDRLSGSLQRATGLTQVRIEPNLVAAESDPSARLTVGQDLTQKLNLVYSMNLADSSDQIYIVEYDITRRFVTRGTRQADNTYRLEFGHNIRFGLPQSERQIQEARVKRLVRNVKIAADSFFPEQQLRDRFKLKPGKTYNFFAVRDGLERIEKLHEKNNLLEARVRVQREEDGTNVDLNVSVRSGPAVEFVFEGWSVPGKVRNNIREIWKDGVFDAQRLDEAVQRIRRALIGDDYLQPEVRTEVTEPAAGKKRVLFDITPGTRYPDAKVLVEGSQSKFPEISVANALLDADESKRIILNRYAAAGFLDTKVTGPVLDLKTAGGRVVFRVAEGARYRLTNITISGNTAYTEKRLRDEMTVEIGYAYYPSELDITIRDMEKLYRAKGFNAAKVTAEPVRGSKPGDLELRFEVEEGIRELVDSITVAGNIHTSESLVRTQLMLKPGDPLVIDDLGRSRRNLYNTGAYTFVDIEREEVSSDEKERKVKLAVRVRETAPFQLRYGGYYDTDRGPGGILDLSNRNMLGSARLIGLRTRYDANLQEGRLYFSQPLLRRFPLQTTASSFFRREIKDIFRTERIGVSVQQQVQLRERFILNYGYRLERAKTVDREPDELVGPLPPIITRIAPLTLTASRDVRDDILDASRGSFISLALEYAPATFGSQLRFAKFFGQYFLYVPLAKPKEIPWQSGFRKTRLVYAAGVRVGLASGLGGQTLVPSERFFAGGGTTIRGFQLNKVGPSDSLGALGGDALFITNHELRFPLISAIDGAGFVDVGNVYSRYKDFSLRDLRKAAGIGLRLRTPYVLLRLDYGIKLDRRPGESLGGFFFSIGQAF